MGLEPDDRDLAALLFTWQSRFVSAAQLHRAFWADSVPRAASRRLAALGKSGLLGSKRFPWLKEGGLYFSSRRGNQCLINHGLLKRTQERDHPRPPEELSPALRHDLGVVDLRLGLEESGVDGRSWISDHQLRIQRRSSGSQERVPDGVFEFSLGPRQGRGVLEYEHSPYHRSAIAALLARLRDRYEEHTLFIVTRTEARAATFREWAAAGGIYGDAPGQIAFSWHGAAARDGLAGNFVDLEGRGWPGGGYAPYAA